jgi:hypothetical protein
VGSRVLSKVSRIRTVAGTTGQERFVLTSTSDRWNRKRRRRHDGERVEV